MKCDLSKNVLTPSATGGACVACEGTVTQGTPALGVASGLCVVCKEPKAINPEGKCVEKENSWFYAHGKGGVEALGAVMIAVLLSVMVSF